MGAYIVRRLLMGLIILIIVSLFVFMVMRLLPGDPLMLYMGNEVANFSPEQYHELQIKFGLQKSLPEQYIVWIGGILRGDLGTSILMQEEVSTLIAKRLPITIHLGILSVLISSILGIAAGVICALRRGKWIDTVVTLLANLGITVPSFWVGILLIYFLSLKLSWLPVSGYTSPMEDFWLSTKQVIMPVFCLSVFSIATLTRQTRSSMLEVVRQDYIRTAMSKGLRERIIVIRHTIKNALIPVVTIMGFQVGVIFGGSVLIETVFNIPGMGRLLTNAVFEQDYQIVQAGVLIMAFFVVIANLVVDISYGWFDPRIRYT
ncbi:MAG: ABC transporter permease [Dehalococcoidales bacterium]|nr:ABC transporter permease [Dehalococcoidales bacterium]